MICPNPMDVRNPKSKYNNAYMKVPCGNCPACLSNKRNEWTIRLMEEMRTAYSAYFITLTYNDENLPINKDYKKETLNKKDLQDFNKRLRKYESKNTNNKIRFYAVGEYGENTERPHYHGIYFNLSEVTSHNIESIWKKGQTVTVVANQATIHYVTKYVINKAGEYKEKQKPFALMSRNKGIGYNYVKRTKKYHQETQNGYHTNGDITSNLPKYYKDKIFTEDQKKKIAQKNMELAAIKSRKEKLPLKHESEQSKNQIFLSINKRIKKGKL